MIIALIGIGCVAWFPFLPPLLISLLIFFLLLLATSYYRLPWLKFLSMAAMGMLWGIFYGHQVNNSIIPNNIEGQPIWVTGSIVGLPKRIKLQQEFAKEGRQFELEVIGALCVDDKKTDKYCHDTTRIIRLSWYENTPLIPGQRWRLLVSLKRPRGLANPGGFDYQSWLIQQSIGGVGYVRKHEGNKLLAHSWTIDRLRFNAADKIDSIFSDFYFEPILKALLLGDKRDITPEQWRLFSRTGTTHLMVISGLHVGLVSLLAFMCLRVVILWCFHSRYSDQAAALLTIFVACVYCCAAGFSLPTQRALIMVSVYMCGIIFQREMLPSQSVVTALFICLIIDPLAPINASFWLSFSAVIIILYGSIGRRYSPAIIRQWMHFINDSLLQSQYRVFVGLLPALFILMGQVSLTSPIANMIAVPLFSVLIVPGTLLTALASCFDFSTAQLIWSAIEVLLEYLFLFLNKLEATHVNTLLLVNSPEGIEKLLYWILAIIGVFIILLPKGFPLRYAGVLLILPIILYRSPPLKYASVDIRVLDVGQGLAIVVKTQSHTLIYDVGAAQGEFFNVANSVVLPFLQSVGIQFVDRLVLSHGDNDHAGGWNTLVDSMFVKQLHYSQWLEGFELTNAKLCQAGYRWRWDGVLFEYLHPSSHALNEKTTQYSSNDLSCVLKISTPKISFLLSGDIERKVELMLINTMREQLQADVLIAPHHGSATSSSWPFIRSVNPKHVVMSSGYRNRFGHPKEHIVKRYQKLNAEVHITSNHGAIHFQVDNEQLLTVYHYRDSYSYQRYWL